MNNSPLFRRCLSFLQSIGVSWSVPFPMRPFRRGWILAVSVPVPRLAIFAQFHNATCRTMTGLPLLIRTFRTGMNARTRSRISRNSSNRRTYSLPWFVCRSIPIHVPWHIPCGIHADSRSKTKINASLCYDHAPVHGSKAHLHAIR